MAQIPPSPRPLRVLVVEDREDTREPLCRLIGRWGYLCKSAPDGKAAIELASAFLPGVVLMDIGLPDMDGWEAARAMRKLPGLEEPIFVALTGYARDADVDRSLAEGFIGHFTKPVVPKELRDLLTQLTAERAATIAQGALVTKPTPPVIVQMACV